MTECMENAFYCNKYRKLVVFGIVCSLKINKKRILYPSSACFVMNINQNVVMKLILLLYKNLPLAVRCYELKIYFICT